MKSREWVYITLEKIGIRCVKEEIQHITETYNEKEIFIKCHWNIL